MNTMSNILENANINPRKIAMVGCGFVGSTSVYAIMQSGIASEIVLIDADQNRAEGEAMDISHAIPFSTTQHIYAGDYRDIKDAALVIVTAGAAQKPGESRLDLVNKNVGIFKSIIPQIKDSGFGGILMIVSNPVDILTYVAWKLSGFSKERVIGSGTVLDSARLKYMLGEHLDVDARNVHAYVIGEHGDSEIVAWSSADVSGVNVNQFCEIRGHFQHESSMKKIADDVKNSAYEIIEKKHATYYGVASAVRRIAEVILKDEKSILPVSSLMEGEYGISDIYLSMPAVVTSSGVETKVHIDLSYEELTNLQNSANTLKEILDKLDLSMPAKEQDK